MKFYVNTRPEIPDRHDEVVSLKERWYTLFQAGLLPADYARGCTTMADVRRKLEAAEFYADAMVAALDEPRDERFPASPYYGDCLPAGLRDQLADAGYGSGGVL